MINLVSRLQPLAASPPPRSNLVAHPMGASRFVNGVGLVETDADVTLDAGREVNLGLEVELDAEEQSRITGLAVVTGGTLEHLACRNRQPL